MKLEKLFSLQNKVAVITGAASGIGRFFSIELASHGCDVILVDKNKDGLLFTEKSCKKSNVKKLSVCADLSKSEQIELSVQEAKQHFDKVHILINSAGVGVIHEGVLDITEAQWNTLMDVNLKAVFFMSQAVAKWMISMGTPGKIINISSAAAYHTTKKRSVYSISKIGVESLTRNFALSLAEHQIDVNCIAPGFVETDLSSAYLKTDKAQSELKHIPMHRPAQLNELTGVLLLLASGASSYVTGSVIRIDGGCAINKV